MASTYVNDLRLNELATGDGSGTWGTTTNTNLELIAEGLSFGTEAITTNADTHTSTVADGATDPARSIYIKYTGTLDSACTITIAPNTLSRLHFIENGTSGSQNIIISQGSGANVTIPPGDVKVVYLDGAGSGAAVVDAFASLSVVDLKVQDDLTVTDDATVGGTLGVTGTTTLSGILDITDTTDASDATGDTGALRTEGGASIAKKLYVGTDLDVDGTTNLDVVDIDGAVDMASTLTVAGAVTGSSSFATAAGGTFTTASGNDLNLVYPDGRSLFFKEAGTTTLTLDNAQGATFAAGATFADGCTITTADNDPQLTLVSTDADANEGPILKFHRNSASPADNDLIGQLLFHGEDGAGNDQQYANIQSIIMNNAQGNEDGRLTFRTLKAGTATSRLDISNAETVFNDSSVDVDFRVESDNEANALFVEGSSGNVGIGTNAPSFGTTSSAGLEIAHATRGILRLEGNSSAQALELYGDSAGGTIDARGSGAELQFELGGSEKARLASDGNLYIAKTSDTATGVGLTLGGGGFIRAVRNEVCGVFNRQGSDGTLLQFARSNSGVGAISVTTSGTTYNTTSDIRLKQDIEPLEATDKLMQMNPVLFNWKADPDGPKNMGFIAQDMQNIMPEAVSSDDTEEKMLRMDYGRITPILVSALQDAHKKIEELESRIAAMESK